MATGDDTASDPFPRPAKRGEKGSLTFRGPLNPRLRGTTSARIIAKQHGRRPAGGAQEIRPSTGVAADVEPEEVEALAEVDNTRLVRVEGQAPGRQPLREPRLDLFGLLLAVAEHDHVVGVPDRDRGPSLGVP